MKTHIQALACLAALLAAVHAAAEDGPRRRGGGPINRRAFATEAVDKSIKKLDELVKRKT